MLRILTKRYRYSKLISDINNFFANNDSFNLIFKKPDLEALLIWYSNEILKYNLSSLDNSTKERLKLESKNICDDIKKTRR